MIHIDRYRDFDRDEVIELVLHCQNDGSRPPTTVDDQPELLHIEEKYFGSGGGFWVAREEGRVIGSIGLMMAADDTAVLKKFFVSEGYRGEPHHLGRRLYAVLLAFAKERRVKQLVLDTPKNTERAHRFYEKAGFRKISEEELPVRYDYPYPDCDFFRLELP